MVPPEKDRLGIFRHIHTGTQNGANKKTKIMQCLTFINKCLIASNNRDILYTLPELVLLSPTGTLRVAVIRNYRAERRRKRSYE